MWRRELKSPKEFHRYSEGTDLGTLSMLEIGSDLDTKADVLIMRRGMRARAFGDPIQTRSKHRKRYNNAILQLDNKTDLSNTLIGYRIIMIKNGDMAPGAHLGNCTATRKDQILVPGQC